MLNCIINETYSSFHSTKDVGLMKNDFSPAEIFTKSIRLWWLVVILTILGGGLGFLIHQILPPVFASRAEITTSINFARSGILSDVQQDQAINAVGDVILSSAVEAAVLGQAADHGISIDGITLKSMRFSDRMGYRWIIGIQSEDLVLAAELTNFWAESSLRILNEYLLHALRAEILTSTLNNLESCLQEVGVVAPSYATCQKLDLSEIQRSIDQTSTQIVTETADSHGIPSFMSFAWELKAEPASSPTYRNRNLMVFSGLLIGFFAGVLIAQISIMTPKIRQK